MEGTSARKVSFLFFLVGIAILGSTLTYLLTAGTGSTSQSASVTSTVTVPHTPISQLKPTPPSKGCSVVQRNFEMGMAFPQWTPDGYGDGDAKWLTELPELQVQSGACWVEIPVLFFQSSLTSTKVTTGQSTVLLSSFTYGIHFAHALGLHVFATPLLDVNGPQSWSGAIKFSTYSQEQQWFESYWQAIKPYAVAAAQAGVEQLSLGTEYEWLQENAPDSLWDSLISEVRSIFPGTLTYDMNWSSLSVPPRSWMHNSNLKMIGVSAYLPIVGTPKRVDPKYIAGMWKNTVKSALDNFARALGEPILVSEIGYRNSADALYNSWESTSAAPPDPQVQEAACDAALANLISDPHILGTFFWGWDDVGAFTLKNQPAVPAIRERYQTLQTSN